MFLHLQLIQVGLLLILKTTKPDFPLQETGCGTGKVRELPCIGNCFDSAYKLPLPCQKAINPGS